MNRVIRYTVGFFLALVCIAAVMAVFLTAGAHGSTTRTTGTASPHQEKVTVTAPLNKHEWDPVGAGMAIRLYSHTKHGPRVAFRITYAVPYHTFQCVKPTILKKPMSLNEWYNKTGVAPWIELKIAAYCWQPTGGWTWRIANLLSGKYGPNYQTALLPVGTRLWDQL